MSQEKIKSLSGQFDTHMKAKDDLHTEITILQK